MYFHTESKRTINWLAAVLTTASDNGRTVRIDTTDGNLRVKIGEGMWTAPIESDFDPNRDNTSGHCGQDSCTQQKDCLSV